MWSIGLLLALSAGAQDDSDDSARGTVEGRVGKGITLTSPDGTLSMTLKSRFQLRQTVFAPSGTPIDDWTSEIIIRRARFTVGGHAFTKDLTYLLQLALSNRDTEDDNPRPLLDAYANYKIGRDLQVRAGQQIVPFSRTRMNSSSVFNLIDRSIVVTELNLDRDVGVQAHSDNVGGLDGRLGYGVGVFSGDGRNRPGESLSYLVAGRVYVRPMGGFDDMVEGCFERHATPKWMLGIGGGYNADSNRPRSTTGNPYEAATFDYVDANVETMVKWHGFSVFGEALVRNADVDRFNDPALGIDEYSRSAWGWFLQGGQMVAPKIEVAARYSHLYPFEGTDPELVETQEVGGGFTYYIKDHTLKFQTDYFYLPVGRAFEGGEHQLRSEFQISL